MSDLEESDIERILPDTDRGRLLPDLPRRTTNMAGDPDVSSLVSKPSPTKLSGMANYRTWSKDLEMILIRMGCWEVTTDEPPDKEVRTRKWKRLNNWARSEIHLTCQPDQQELIHDSETAYESWRTLKMRYARPSELTTIRLRKEFASLSMTEKDYGEYLKRAKKLVSELKAVGIN